MGSTRIIDFPLSNCINSGIDTVGVLTQYQPLRLNTHIGIGIPWDLDRNVGGVTVLPPYERAKAATGIPVQPMRFTRIWNIWKRIILSTCSSFPVITFIRWIMRLCWIITKRIMRMSPLLPCLCLLREASRFGILITDEANRITEFEESPLFPEATLLLWVFIFSAGPY